MLESMDQQNPYSFFLSQNQQQKPTRTPASPVKRALLFGGFLVVLAVVALVVVSLFSAGSRSNADLLYQLAAAQTDLADIADTGAQKARDPSVRTLSATSQIVYISQNNQTSALLGKKINKKKLAAYRNTQYEKTLDDAETSGKFDAVYVALLTQRADAYRMQLQKVYAAQKSTKLKKELAAQYQAVVLLTKRQ